MTNKIQFLITKMTLINQYTIWSFVFDNYLRFEICDLLFETLCLSAFAIGIYAIIAKNFVILAKFLLSVRLFISQRRHDNYRTRITLIPPRKTERDGFFIIYFFNS
jgi:hypothetical protein